MFEDDDDHDNFGINFTKCSILQQNIKYIIMMLHNGITLRITL